MNPKNAVAGLAAVLLLVPLAAQKPQRQAESKAYVRITEELDEPQALQTAITRFVPREGNSGLVVDLVGVIHYGEKGYYRKLDRSFAQYDAVLYELVAPEDRNVPPKGGGRGDDPLRLLQRVTQSVLGLAAQLDHVDYTRKNFVHADLSPKQMWQAMQDRGEDGLTLALGITADMLRQYNLEAKAQKNRKPARSPDLLASLTQPGGMTELKRQFATELVRQSTKGSGLGRTLNTLLVEDRNKAAMKVLTRQITKGRKRIAIFYGAAHMPDFEQRLASDFGMKRIDTKWVTAWDLRASDETAIERVLQTLLQEAVRDMNRNRPRPARRPVRKAPEVRKAPKATKSKSTPPRRRVF